MTTEGYQKRNLKPDFSTALAKTPPEPRPRRFYNREPEQTGMRWLITFTDIMGLMLTFFVMMYAMSEPEHEKFAEIASSLNGEFSPFYGDTRQGGPEDSVDMRRINFNRALDLGYLKALIGRVIEQDEALKTKAVLTAQGEGLAMSVPTVLDFDAGQAALREGSAKTLFTLGGSLSRIKNQVGMVGYAGNEGASQNGGSDWALSLSRAAAVAGALEKVGYTQAVTLHGAASEIIEENQSRDLSRRVDIVIMNHDGKTTKVFRD